MHQEKPSGTIRAGATMAVEKRHGPNSPQVLSGELPEGYVEHVQGMKKTIEVDFDRAVEMWGEETARQLFANRDSRKDENG
jgi:hypothetical protein